MDRRLGPKVNTNQIGFWVASSVTRLGDFLHFGQPFKAFDNNNFAQISYILSQFL